MAPLTAWRAVESGGAALLAPVLAPVLGMVLGMVLAIVLGGCGAGDVEQQRQRDFQALREDLRATNLSLDATKTRTEREILDLRRRAEEDARGRTDLMTRLQELATELRLAQGRLEEGARGGGEATRRVDQMAERVATLSSQVLSLEGQIQAQQERLDQTARPAAAAAAPPAPGPATAPARPTDPPPAAAGEGPDQVYRAALTEFTRKNYEQAGRGFQAFLAAFPQDSRSADAQYWYAESLRGQGNYAQAAQEFEAFVKRSPENPKVPTAQVRYGESLLLNGDKAAGCPVLQGVRRQHGRTRAGALAQDLMVQYCS